MWPLPHKTSIKMRKMKAKSKIECRKEKKILKSPYKSAKISVCSQNFWNLKTVSETRQKMLQTYMWPLPHKTSVKMRKMKAKSKIEYRKEKKILKSPHKSAKISACSQNFWNLKTVSETRQKMLIFILIHFWRKTPLKWSNYAWNTQLLQNTTMHMFIEI